METPWHILKAMTWLLRPLKLLMLLMPKKRMPMRHTPQKPTSKKRTLKSLLLWRPWEMLLKRTNRWTLQAQNMQKRPTRLNLMLLLATMATVPHTT